jgi:hypothetical protein
MEAGQTGESRPLFLRRVGGIRRQFREALTRNRVVWIDFKRVHELFARGSAVSGKQLPFAKIGEPLNQLEAGVFP